MKILDEKAVNALRDSLSGRIILPQNNEYEEIRKIWNVMIDRKPAIIVQCRNSDDVVKSNRFARSNQLEISIRGGGHNIAGSALCDDGLLIDFSTMKNVRIDAEKKRAFVEPGATLADFDEEAQKYGLATPLGVNSTTGIAGITVGGEEENERIKSAFGKNYERLVEIKRKYDPENIFHNNQNIKP